MDKDSLFLALKSTHISGGCSSVLHPVFRVQLIHTQQTILSHLFVFALIISRCSNLPPCLSAQATLASFPEPIALNSLL